MWRCMYRASYCNVYINQRDAQSFVNSLYFFVKWLCMFWTNDSPKHAEPFNEKIKTIHKTLCISLVYIHTGWMSALNILRKSDNDVPFNCWDSSSSNFSKPVVRKIHYYATCNKTFIKTNISTLFQERFYVKYKPTWHTKTTSDLAHFINSVISITTIDTSKWLNIPSAGFGNTVNRAFGKCAYIDWVFFRRFRKISKSDY